MDVAVHNGVKIPHIGCRAGIFYSLVGMEEVITDLGTKPCFRLQFVLRCLLRFPFFLLNPREFGPQHLPGQSTILVLATLRLTSHDFSGG